MLREALVQAMERLRVARGDAGSAIRLGPGKR
jgi:hypothetical protein